MAEAVAFSLCGLYINHYFCLFVASFFNFGLQVLASGRVTLGTGPAQPPFLLGLELGLGCGVLRILEACSCGVPCEVLALLLSGTTRPPPSPGRCTRIPPARPRCPGCVPLGLPWLSRISVQQQPGICRSVLRTLCCCSPPSVCRAVEVSLCCPGPTKAFNLNQPALHVPLSRQTW